MSDYIGQNNHMHDYDSFLNNLRRLLQQFSILHATCHCKTYDQSGFHDCEMLTLSRQAYHAIDNLQSRQTKKRRAVRAILTALAHMRI